MPYRSGALISGSDFPWSDQVLRIRVSRGTPKSARLKTSGISYASPFARASSAVHFCGSSSPGSSELVFHEIHPVRSSLRAHRATTKTACLLLRVFDQVHWLTVRSVVGRSLKSVGGSVILILLFGAANCVADVGTKCFQVGGSRCFGAVAGRLCYFEITNIFFLVPLSRRRRQPWRQKLRHHYEHQQ